MDLSLFKFRHNFRVRWAEVDMQGIVFNGHYFMYMDVGIAEYFRALGITFPEGVHKYGSDTFVKKATLEYHAPALYDNVLDTYVRCANLGNSSLQFEIAICRGQDCLVSGEIIYVNADLEARRPMRIPDEMRKMFIDFEKGSLS
jgi:acyl-CoA thioester hydrolase